jgi:hypothetical protein
MGFSARSMPLRGTEALMAGWRSRVLRGRPKCR